MIFQSPCLNCEKRSVLCRARCYNYKRYKNGIEYIKEKRKNFEFRGVRHKSWMS